MVGSHSCDRMGFPIEGHMGYNEPYRDVLRYDGAVAPHDVDSAAHPLPVDAPEAYAASATCVPRCIGMCGVL